jgi:hypothetical protein
VIVSAQCARCAESRHTACRQEERARAGWPARQGKRLRVGQKRDGPETRCDSRYALRTAGTIVAGCQRSARRVRASLVEDVRMKAQCARRCSARLWRCAVPEPVLRKMFLMSHVSYLSCSRSIKADPSACMYGSTLTRIFALGTLEFARATDGRLFGISTCSEPLTYTPSRRQLSHSTLRPLLRLAPDTAA